MAQYSPVVPTWLAKQIGKEKMGDYHLLLAHDVLDHPNEYTHLYGSNNNTIIMDNSLVELGHPIEMPKMVEACRILQPTCIVLPDYLGDSEGTVEASWQAAAHAGAMLHGMSLMGVIQGRTINEAIGCAVRLMMIPGINCLSIPRVLTEYLGSRVPITQMVLNMFPQLKLLHLLGFSDDLVDDVNAASIPGVSGIDSAVPARLGLKSQLLSMDCYVDAGKRGNYWDDEQQLLHDDPVADENDDRLHVIGRNFENIRRWIA